MWLFVDLCSAVQTCGRGCAVIRLHGRRVGMHRRRVCGCLVACRPAGPAAAILAALPLSRTGRAVPVERDQSGIVRQSLFRFGQRIRRDRCRVFGLVGDMFMMVVDSLYVVVFLVVLLSMSFDLQPVR